VSLSASPSPYLDLSVVIRALRGAVGGWGGRGWLSQALTMLLFQRLGRICGQMERMCQRFAAGRLWRRVARADGDARVVADGRARAVALLRWPGRFGWLVRAAAWHAAGYGCQLREVLVQPEMVALLKAAPQAARVLRPLCRMLAVDASLLRPGVAAVPARVVEVGRVRVRKPRVVIDFGRIPLPRGVLSAARRQGFGKLV